MLVSFSVIAYKGNLTARKYVEGMVRMVRMATARGKKIVTCKY